MREGTNVRQIPGEGRRRWFSSDDFDLIIWLNDDGSFAGFELCYDKRHNEHSLVWNPVYGFAHMAVDDGESGPGKYKASPILIASGYFDARRIHTALIKEAHSLPKEVAGYVLHALEEHPNFTATL